MNTFKRVVALILMIFSVIGLLAVIAGIIGSWSLDNSLSTATVGLLTAGENAVAAVDQSVNRIDQRLASASNSIDAIETRAEEMGDNAKENSLIVAVISNTIGAELAPVISQAQDTADTIRETTAAINEAVEAINAIPFVSLDDILPSPDIFKEISTALADLKTDVAETRTAVKERKAEIVDGGVSIITDRTSKLNGGLNKLQEKTGNVDAKLTASAAKLANLKSTILKTLTLITIAVNAALLFVGLAFISLFLHSWRFFKNPETPVSSIIYVE